MSVEEKGIAYAVEQFAYAECAKLFVVVGIAPTESEANCCAWVVDLCSSFLVDILRGDSNSAAALQAAFEHTKAFSQSMAAAFMEIAKLSDFMEALRGVEILLESAAKRANDAAAPLPHPPSALKSSIDSVETSLQEGHSLKLA